MYRSNVRQTAGSALALLLLWRCAAGDDGGWTQALPPVIGLGIAGVYVLVDRIAGATIELRRNHREGMRSLAARDTAAAVKAFQSAVSIHDDRMRPSSRTRSRTVAAFQACRQRLADIETARGAGQAAPPAQAEQAEASSAAQTAPLPQTGGPGGPLQPFESESGQWGYRNAAGGTVIAPRFATAQPFTACGIATAVDSAGWAVIDTTGDVRLRPLVVDNGPDYFSEGLARFVKDARVGFYDSCGAVVIEPRFTFAGPFSAGFAPFCEGCRMHAEDEHTAVTGGQWGYVARDGRVALQPAYEQAEAAQSGQGRVLEKGAWKTVPLGAPAAQTPK